MLQMFGIGAQKNAKVLAPKLFSPSKNAEHILFLTDSLHFKLRHISMD